uniref:Uncharacterized protein n=1 Tax=Glossina austeni TaxID=7395 RepID=A0A1A9ULZ0_GLOAU
MPTKPRVGDFLFALKHERELDWSRYGLFNVNLSMALLMTLNIIDWEIIYITIFGCSYFGISSSLLSKTHGNMIIAENKPHNPEKRQNKNSTTYGISIWMHSRTFGV